MIEMNTSVKVLKADFKKIFEKKGYAFFDKGNYNLNIIGVRRASNVVTNKFDDFLVVIYNTPTEQNVRKIYACTTKPGKKAMNNPTNPKGTAILKEGQYRGAYKIGLHKGQYKALCQAKPLPVYRDNNKDNKYDLNPLNIDNGVFGINIHKAGNRDGGSTIVDGWSYGCTVISKKPDFDQLMRLVERSAKLYGNSFTYTIINEKDITDYEQ